MQKQVLAKSYIVGIEYLDKLVQCGPSSQVLNFFFFFVKQDIPRTLRLFPRSQVKGQ